MRLEKLFADVAERIKGREYVEIEPRQMSDAMKTTLWALWHTEPEKVRPKALAMAAEVGLHFQPYMYPDGRSCVLFSRAGSPLSRKTQKMRASCCKSVADKNREATEASPVIPLIAKRN